MQTDKNSNEKKNISKRKRSKFLLRRMAIVSICLLIIWLIISLVSKGLKGDEKTTQETPVSTEEIDLIDQSETTDTPSESTDSSENTTESLTEMSSDSSTESTTQSFTASTTESKTESKTESTIKEDINMDFTSVSYYIQTLEQRYQAYYDVHKAMNASEIVRDVNMNLDYDFYGHIEKVKDPNALSVICNKYYQLPSDFTPEHLKSVPEGYFIADGKTYQLKQNALEAFISMADAAKAEGLSLRIISAYRTNSYQANLYQKYKNNNGQTAADRFSARPGHSEHETGLAIDINDVAMAFENTKAFSWLTENAHKYGYVLRYPDGKEAITGYMYEPWHYRYLGVEVATQLKQSGLTYDAYYAMYLLK
jgi:D-alanyl-D-alanine carboxypeptidase